MYRCVATTVQGFVQQLAVAYVRNGYWLYVAGQVPAGKDAGRVDAKLLARYGVATSRWAKARAWKAGEAKLQYLRHGGFFLLLATRGRHCFFTEERRVLRSLRREPVTCFGYSVSYRGGHPHVRIEHKEYLMLKEHFLKIALRHRPERVAWEFRALPFEPYAPVRRQLLAIFRAVNDRRKRAGLEPLDKGCVRLRRKVYRPFAEPDPSAARRADRYFARFGVWVRRAEVGEGNGEDESAA
jgi:hypothetical protein